MKRITISVGLIAVVAAVVVGGTGAFFSDTETSQANTFTSGGLDLLVDSEAHYAGLVCVDGEWTYDNDDQVTTRQDLIGEPCEGTWTETDLGPALKFFSLNDLKPGDHGENTISLHVIDNDAWVCNFVNNMQDDDQWLTNPEQEAGDNSDGAGNGEMAAELSFFAWTDDGSQPGFQGQENDAEEGDNIWQSNENKLFSNTDGPASDVLDGVVYPLYTPDTTGDPLQGTTTSYIGLYWCYGDIDASDPGNLECDGSSVTNLSQTDQLTADIGFYIEQARNNPGFECPVLDEFDRESVGAVASAYSEPEAEQCTHTVDGGGDGDFTTIQAAEDVASDGETICVDTGDYPEDVTVDVPNLTILGLNDPKGVDAATVDGRMDIDSSGVTISGLGFTNPDDGYGVVIDGGDGIEISFNSFFDIGTAFSGASAQAIYYDGTPGAASGLSIHDNMIDGVGSASLDPGAGAGSSAKGIFIGDSTSPDALTGVEIEDNMISDIAASTAEFGSGGRGGYGILINYGVGSTGSVPGAIVRNNAIETVAGWWVHAIGLETDTPGASVTHNAISDLSGASGDSSAVFFEGNPNSDVAVNVNNFAPGVPFGVGIHPSNSAISVDAENNWWGDLDPSDNVAESFGTIDFDPYEAGPYPEN